jgi:ribonuclease HI
MPFYAVRKGRKTGVFTTWDETKKSVIGYNGAIYKKFDTEEEANTFATSTETTRNKTKPKQKDITEFFQRTADPEENDKFLFCFTDGSALDNGNPNSKGGFGVIWPFHEEYNCAQPLQPTTNNRAEYLAVIHAIQIANNHLDTDNGRTLIIYTDCMLLINSLVKWLPKWKQNDYKKADGKTISNLDLVKELEQLISVRKVVFRHVKAHTNGTSWEAVNNDKVDNIAKQSAISQKHIGFIE